MHYTAVFRDCTRAPVTDLHWSPQFTTGIARRHDGFKRCVFITPSGAHPDPWILRLEPAPGHVVDMVA